ncbi:MAG TPA: transcription termination factor NusA [Methylomirabilota bacterium]|nr:transcription termination factor NusA [Methylomirabilota bacterium]
MSNKDLINAIGQMANEKGIDKEILFEALESAVLSGFKKTKGGPENLRVHLDRQTGALRLYARKKVVAEPGDPELEIGLEAARALNSDARLDDEIEVELDSQKFGKIELGRIAAQTAKQVVLQRVRDAERDAVFAEFADKEGRIVRGTVHRIEKRNVVVELGRAEAVMPEREQIPGERCNPGDRVRAVLLEVRKTVKGPQLLLSRTHPEFLVRLFEAEIPEIAEGIVQVKGAAREPGERAKVAVASAKRDVDPIGACVGLRGTRIQVISRELRGEKIDIVEWSPDPVTFVARALSPAKVSSVTVLAPEAEGEQASVLVIVPDNQLSLAIGKKGQNARLAAKLTGFRVDIKSEGEIEEERRREEEERAQGREALQALPGVGPALVDRLVEAGLYSPARIVEAGAEALEALPGVGEKKAAALYEGAQTWVVEHPPIDAEAEAAEAAGEPAADEEAVDAGETPHASPRPAPVE